MKKETGWKSREVRPNPLSKIIAEYRDKNGNKLSIEIVDYMFSYPENKNRKVYQWRYY